MSVMSVLPVNRAMSLPSFHSKVISQGQGGLRRADRQVLPDSLTQRELSSQTDTGLRDESCAVERPSKPRIWPPATRTGGVSLSFTAGEALAAGDTVVLDPPPELQAASRRIARIRQNPPRADAAHAAGDRFIRPFADAPLCPSRLAWLGIGGLSREGFSVHRKPAP